jgi:hypothetical protein
MIILRFSILVALVFAGQASDVIQQECAVDGSGSVDCDESEERVTDDDGSNNNIYENDDTMLIAEASNTFPNATSPAPKVTAGLGADLGEIQFLDAVHSEVIKERIREAQEYMRDVVMVEQKYDKVRSICRNNDASCTFWAVLGECEATPGCECVLGMQEYVLG